MVKNQPLEARWLGFEAGPRAPASRGFFQKVSGGMKQPADGHGRDGVGRQEGRCRDQEGRCVGMLLEKSDRGRRL